MATKNIYTDSFTSTHDNSKEETTMKANMNTFAKDCTRPFTFANLFYRAIILGEELSRFCTNEDYLNYRLALYVATGDMDPDFDDAYAITHPDTVADMTEICAATCDYHCVHWNECPFGKGEDDPTAGIYTTYAHDTDITFIMQDTTLNGETATTRVVGFYHGEPNDAATERFYGKLMADYVHEDEEF